MKREDIKKLFPDATDEQITSMLNAHNTELATERGKTKKFESDLNALQREKEERDNADKSELEVLQGQFDKLQKQLEESAIENKSLKLKSQLAEKGITGDSASKLIESLNSGEFNVDILGDIISEREKSAVASYEKQQMDNTGEPGGSAGGEGGKEKTPDVEIAEGIKFGGLADNAQSARDFYK